MAIFIFVLLGLMALAFPILSIGAAFAEGGVNPFKAMGVMVLIGAVIIVCVQFVSSAYALVM